jgi:hypothetical protein
MGLYESRGGLTKAMSELLLRWRDTKTEWRDAVADRFEERYITPLERDLQHALGAMDQMASLLARIRSECGEDRT